MSTKVNAGPDLVDLQACEALCDEGEVFLRAVKAFTMAVDVNASVLAYLDYELKRVENDDDYDQRIIQLAQERLEAEQRDDLCRRSQLALAGFV